jgi:hypothetical protein
MSPKTTPSAASVKPAARFRSAGRKAANVLIPEELPRSARAILVGGRYRFNGELHFFLTAGRTCLREAEAASLRRRQGLAVRKTRSQRARRKTPQFSP